VSALDSVRIAESERSVLGVEKRRSWRWFLNDDDVPRQVGQFMCFRSERLGNRVLRWLGV
jgi:hypothetical protein